VIGPNVVIGPGVIVDSGVRIMNSVLFEGCEIGSNSCLDGALIGWKSKVGKWVRIDPLTLIGEDVVISNEVYLNGIIALPNISIKTSKKEQKEIIMF
jgi:mannose-1-phosphate guanylyltransferase